METCLRYLYPSCETSYFPCPTFINHAEHIHQGHGWRWHREGGSLTTVQCHVSLAVKGLTTTSSLSLMMTIPGHGPMTHHMHIRREESIANGHKHNPYFLGFQVLDPFAGASPSPTTSKMHIPLIWHPLSQSHVNTVLPTYRSETCYSHISTLHACIASKECSTNYIR